MADLGRKLSASDDERLARPAASAVEADLSAAVIDELKAEVASLRRENRLLRIANNELERVAICDTLTPLFNRRHFLTALYERIARAKRYDATAAVLFIDINRMKLINDEHGHSAGDFALVHAAQLVQAQQQRDASHAAYLGLRHRVLRPLLWLPAPLRRIVRHPVHSVQSGKQRRYRKVIADKPPFSPRGGQAPPPVG